MPLYWKFLFLLTLFCLSLNLIEEHWFNLTSKRSIFENWKMYLVVLASYKPQTHYRLHTLYTWGDLILDLDTFSLFCLKSKVLLNFYQDMGYGGDTLSGEVHQKTLLEMTTFVICFCSFTFSYGVLNLFSYEMSCYSDIAEGVLLSQDKNTSIPPSSLTTRQTTLTAEKS